MYKIKLKQSKSDKQKHLWTLEIQSNRWASSERTGPSQKAWSVSKLTSLFQDLSLKGISETLSKNAFCSRRIVGQTMAKKKQEEYVSQIKSANWWPRQSQRLTRLVQEPPRVVVKGPYAIPLVRRHTQLTPCTKKNLAFHWRLESGILDINLKVAWRHKKL